MKKYFFISIILTVLIIMFMPVRVIVCGAELGQVKEDGILSDGSRTALPFGIYLDSVSVQYNPYYLYMVDIKSKKALPKRNPAKIDVREGSGSLCRWKIDIDKFISSASMTPGKDTVMYDSFEYSGGAPACLIQASSESDGRTVTGWVCGGSMMFRPKSLNVSGDTSIVLFNHTVKDINSIIRITDNGSLSAERIHLGPHSVVYRKACIIKQIVPISYDDKDTGTSDFKVYKTILGAIISRRYFFL